MIEFRWTQDRTRLILSAVRIALQRKMTTDERYELEQAERQLAEKWVTHKRRHTSEKRGRFARTVNEVGEDEGERTVQT